MEATRDMAAHLSQLAFENLPDVVVEQAKLAIIDTLGVAVAGSQHEVLDVVVDVAGSGGVGESTVIGRELGLGAASSAFVNGCAAHVLDYDDSGHSSAHVVPTVLALAEREDRPGRDLLVAFVAGREMRMQLNAEIDTGRFDVDGRGPGSRGWHATGTLGSLGSAVAAARVLGLDPDQTAMCIGLAASLASGIISNFGTTTKCVHVGNAARNGVESASLVARGFTADATVLTSRRGFVDAMCLEGECDIDRVAAAVRSSFLLEDRGNRIKPYPACTGTHRIIGAVRAILDQQRIHPDDVERISYTAQPSLVCARPTTGLECKFSGAFAAVATIIDGAITMQNCTEQFLARSDVQKLLARTIEAPQESGGWVEIETRDGATHRHSFVAPPSLTTYDEVAAKFRACAEPVVGEEAASTILLTVQDLEHLDSTRRLAGLLRPLARAT